MFFGISLFLVSLILNTSFHIMGVDIGEFIGSMLGEFAVVILFAYTKILLVSVVFFGTIGYLIHIDARNFKGSYRLEWIVFFYIILISFFHSVVKYPQIYGEFFYIRYPSLIPLLHFLTDTIPPIFPSIFLWMGIIGILGHIFLKAILVKNQDASFLTTAWLVFFIIHFYGNFSLLLLFFLSLPWLKASWKKLSFSQFIISVCLILGLGVFPYIWEVLYFAANQHLGKLSTSHNSTGKHNIFILSADSLRYDRLGINSGNPEISPNIDEFSKDAFIFNDHHVTIPRTFPSWADLLTGEFSMAHGIRDMFPAPSEKRNIGTSRFPTLPQILGRIGYHSAVIGNFAADIFPRANFGFQEIYTPDFNAKVLTVQRGLDSQIFLLPILTGSFLFGGEYIKEVDGLSTLGDGSRLLPKFKYVIRRNSDQPLFLVNFSSVVHFPYTPPYPYYKKFTDKNYYGRYKYLKFVDPSSDEKPSSEDVEQIRSVFDSAIHAYDSEFGDMIQFLKNSGIYDESIIILTADHGESLYEDIHGQGHGEHLRGENVTKVPFYIKMPKSYMKEHFPERVESSFSNSYDGITSSIDIFPTLLDYLNIAPQQGKPGESLLPLLGQSKPTKSRSVYSETGIWFSDRGNQFFQKQRIPYPNILFLHKVVPEEDYEIMITDKQFRETIAFSKHRSLQNSRYKLIYIPTREGVVYELYDRIQDPLNTQNLWKGVLGTTIGINMKRELLDLVNKNSKVKIIGEYILPLDLP
jgi:arylsulfatase A-like enzyme